MRPRSLQQHLTLIVAVAVACTAFLACLVAYLVVADQLRSQVDQALSSEAVEYAPRGRTAMPETGDSGRSDMSGDYGQTDDHHGYHHYPHPPNVLPIPSVGRQNGLVFLRVAADGSVISGNGALLSTSVSHLAEKGGDAFYADVHLDARHLRLYAYPVSGGGAVVLARSLDGVDQVLDSLREVLLALFLAATIAATLITRWLVRRRLRAIEALTQTAQMISETLDTSRRIDSTGDDEVGQLATAFNKMLDQLEQASTAQRRLISDTSHELRTPVASLRNDIETILAHPELPQIEQHEILAGARKQTEELTELIASVIDLGRIGEGAAQMKDLSIQATIEDAIGNLQASGCDREITLNGKEGTVHADRLQLLRALTNLLENAVKYSPEGTPVSIEYSEAGVTVCNQGKKLTPDEAERAFDRFWRGPETREQPGSGLGLAIVAEIAAAHGWVVSIDQSEKICFNIDFQGIEFPDQHFQVF